MCFILSAITAIGHLGAIVGLLGSMNTLSSKPSAKQGSERHNRGCLQGGPAVARLGTLLFLPGCSGGFLRRRIQGDLGPGSLALWEASPSISPTLRGSGLSSRQLRLFSCLLSGRRSGATGSRGRAGAFSVASPETTSESPWSIQQSPPQLVQKGCLTRPERRGRELCPPLSSPLSWARGGTPTLSGWTLNTWWLGRWLWLHIEPGLSCSSGPWERLNPDRLPQLGLSLSSLFRMTWRPSFPKRTSNFDSSDHRTVFHFATVLF